MNISLATKLWLAWRASKKITATMQSKTTVGQAGATATLGAVLAFAISIFNAQFPENALSVEAAAGLIGVVLTVLSPVLSRYISLTRDPSRVFDDPAAAALKVKRHKDASWTFSSMSLLDAQAEGYDLAVIRRADGDGDVIDLATGITVGFLRLPKPKEPINA